MMTKKASTVLMIRPVRFGFNEQTAETNSFQQNEQASNFGTIQKDALEEFDAFANKLKANGINVLIFDDTDSPHTPDSIFPNNWISFHNNRIVLYPMLAVNRRNERRNDIIDFFNKDDLSLIDLSKKELENRFLEGTGSIVFDSENKIAYANISPRTNEALLKELCDHLGYKAVTFKATDNNNSDIYHTNVLMCLGKDFVVLCEECITDNKDKTNLLLSLRETNHEIININRDQMNSFAGNMYQLFNDKGESLIIMSEQAYRALEQDQINKLNKYGKLLYSPLYTIEKYGGGSARCMIADVVGY